jgi:hypothetical protein
VKSKQEQFTFESDVRILRRMIYIYVVLAHTVSQPYCCRIDRDYQRNDCKDRNTISSCMPLSTETSVRYPHVRSSAVS